MEYFRFHIEPLPTEQLVSVTALGPLSREGFIRMVTSARIEAHQRGWNLLYDMRQLYLPHQLHLEEVLSFVNSRLNSEEARRLRSASLVVEELLAEEIWEVYRYATRTCHLQWAFFTNRQQALEWLKNANETDSGALSRL